MYSGHYRQVVITTGFTVCSLLQQRAKLVYCKISPHVLMPYCCMQNVDMHVCHSVLSFSPHRTGRDVRPPLREEHVLNDFKPQQLPKIGVINVVITEIVDPAHFWGQRVDISEMDQLNALMHRINMGQSALQPLPVPPEDLVGQCCLAPYSQTGQLYRAKVTSVMIHSSIAAVSEGCMSLMIVLWL